MDDDFYDEYEDLYADELELADELHSHEPALPTERVLLGRDDGLDSDTPRTTTTISAKRMSDQLVDDSPPRTPTPSLQSVRKRLKLNNEPTADDFSLAPDSPQELIMDEDADERSTANPRRPPSRQQNLSQSEPLFSETQFEPDDVQADHFAGTSTAASSAACWTDESSYALSLRLRVHEGRLKFVGLRDETWCDNVEDLHVRSHRGNLLSRPFWDIWTEAREELERRKSLPDRPDGVVENHATQSLPEGLEAGKTSECVDGVVSPVAASLWVEKYRPRHFMELLSDDGVNRTLLQWLKLWDCVVFGRNPKPKPHPEKLQQPGTGNNTFVKKFLPELSQELDEHKRPQQKVVLLYGPPGLGKTTLAHVIARHAGYNVVELNASDDRSPEVFKTTLEAATQMRAVLGQDPRPNCLIIDEIDGAPAASINMLVNMIKSSGPTNTGTGKKRSRKEGSLLLRPVICICNELYVPALRPLRQIALALHFPQIAKTRLASRLQEIMRRERMKGDTAAILALCEKAENDVRSCLSTLQFVQSRKQQLTLTDVRTFNVGQKDIQRGLFSVLQEVFQKPRNDRKAYRQLYGDEDPTLSRLRSPEDLRFENLVHSTQAFGDYEKFVQALFDNYVHVNFKDPNFQTIQQGPEWLCFVDGLLNTVHRLQNYSLYPYLPYVAPAFHCAFSVLPYTKMVFQNSFLEARGKETQLSNILSSLRADTSPQSRCYLTGSTLVLDVLPWLTGILQPTIRPVNTQLFSAEERQKLQQVISVMASFNLTYHQARTADGVYQYALEPSIDEVTRFPGVTQPPQLTYATKQLIARELEVEKMRRGDVPDVPVPVKETYRNPNAAATPWKPPPKPSFKPVEESPRVVLDFFGRVIQKPIQGASAGSSSGADRCSGGLGSGQIYYQFKEGFSNAVRRTVRMKDLL
ncbi:chromosome transmission fidelity protein 18 homolog [Ixodes scapularis]